MSDGAEIKLESAFMMEVVVVQLEGEVFVQLRNFRAKIVLCCPVFLFFV